MPTLEFGATNLNGVANAATVRITYTQSINETLGKSTVTFTGLEVRSNLSYGYAFGIDGYIKFNGITVCTCAQEQALYIGQTGVWYNCAGTFGSTTVYHDDGGEASFTVSFHNKTAGWSGFFFASSAAGNRQFRVPNGTSSTVQLEPISKEEESETVEPSKITVPDYPVQMGTVMNITLTRYSPYCTHDLIYRKAGSGGVYTAIVQKTAQGCAWQVPDLMNLCPNGLEVELEIACITYLNGTACGMTSATVTLTAPDATIPTCNTTAVMGSSLSVTLERHSASYTHDLSYAFSGLTGEITAGAQASFTWEIPLELAKQIPLLTRGTCVITCVTYNGTAEVGRKNVTLSLSVPDNDLTKPEAAMTLSPAGELGEAFRGMYIRGMTGVLAEFTAESAYSQVKEYQLTVDGVSVSGNPARSACLNSHGEVTVTGRVTDARGYTREITQTISVIAYDRPRVIPYRGESAVVAVRCDPDGTRNPKGQHLLIRAGRKYTALPTSGGQLNYCDLKYRIKPAGAEDYPDFYTLLQGENLEDDCVQLVVNNAVPELKVNYTVQIEAVDTLGGYSVITVPVAALTIPLHIGRGSGNVAVGKYCDYSRSDAFEIGFTTYFDTGIALRKIFAQGEWSVGADLGSTAADAEVSAVPRYTLFMAVCGGVPVWLMRLGTEIYGSGMKMTCDGSVMLLQEAPDTVTALYAVI